MAGGGGLAIGVKAIRPPRMRPNPRLPMLRPVPCLQGPETANDRIKDFGGGDDDVKAAVLSPEFWITAGFNKEAGLGMTAWNALSSFGKGVGNVASKAAPSMGGAAAGGLIGASQAPMGGDWKDTATYAAGGAAAGGLGAKFAPKTTGMSLGLGGTGAIADAVRNRQTVTDAASHMGDAAREQFSTQGVSPTPQQVQSKAQELALQQPLPQSHFGAYGAAAGLGGGALAKGIGRFAPDAEKSLMTYGSRAAGGTAALTGTMATVGEYAHDRSQRGAMDAIKSPEAAQVVQDKLKEIGPGMLQKFPQQAADWIFQNTGLHKLLGSFGIDVGAMQPWQKIMLIAGILGGGAGLLSGNKTLGGAGALGMLGAFGPQLMSAYQGLGQGGQGQAAPSAAPGFNSRQSIQGSEGFRAGPNFPQMQTGMSAIDEPAYPDQGFATTWNQPR
jgi:hypothetical protein